MKTDQAIKLLEAQEVLDKIYQFSYHRCNTSHEAEDLCSDILLAMITSLTRQEYIDNFYAYLWAVARRVYADFCARKSKLSQSVSIEDFAPALAAEINEIELFIEDAAAAEQFKRILNRIAFLSKGYRDVMVMYYLDEIKVKDIAQSLRISETTVKQRLFSARNTVRKEVDTMKLQNLSLKPIKLDFFGTGIPYGNDPRIKAERILSQNLIYLCRDKPKTAKELSEELCIPMLYIEEELAIQCYGANGSYGTLKKLDNGKYISNILLVDYTEYDEANKIYGKHLPELCSILRENLEKYGEKILAFPYLSPQKDLSFILWAMITPIISNLEWKINHIITDKYFADIVPAERDFSTVAIASREGDDNVHMGFYGNDVICALAVGGYKAVSLSNIYGKRMDKHFSCSYNFSQDEKLLMTLKAIGGLPADNLNETEKEIAAKAIACGYLRRTGDILEPKMVVMEKEHQKTFYDLSYLLHSGTDDMIEAIAAESAAFMKKHIPPHLINEYRLYTELIAGVRIHSETIEECIKTGLLTAPENRLGAEGMIMIVEK